MAASIWLVEDDPRVRARLEGVLKAHPQLEFLGSAASLAAGRAALASRVPDVLLTDLGLPDGRGETLIDEVSRRHPEVRILVITVFADEQTVISALEAGASGYLMKDADDAALQLALSQLLDGGAPICPSIARHLLRRLRPEPTPAADPSVHLTGREQEVLQLLAKGYIAKEVAELLSLSPHTVTAHVRSIYRKLAVRSRAEAIYEAVQMGLIRMS